MWLVEACAVFINFASITSLKAVSSAIVLIANIETSNYFILPFDMGPKYYSHYC